MSLNACSQLSVTVRQVHYIMHEILILDRRWGKYDAIAFDFDLFLPNLLTL